MLYILLFICLFSGLYLWVKGVSKTLSNVKGKIKRVSPEDMDRALENRFFLERSMDKDRIKYIKNEESGRIEKLRTKVKGIITHKDTSWNYLSFTLLTLLFAAIGYWLGASKMNNFLAGLLLALFFAVLPYWYGQLKITRIGKDKDEKLLIVMSNIQSAYMKQNSFVNAVREVLPNIPKPLNQYFRLFVDEVTLYGTDGCLVPSMEKLSISVDNYFFSEYIQLAIQAERGEMSLKATMQSVPKDYQNYLVKNREFAAIVEDYNLQFLVRIIAIPVAIGFLKVISEDFFNVLVEHPIGKISFALLILIYMAAAVLYSNFNKEIKLEL